MNTVMGLGRFKPARRSLAPTLQIRRGQAWQVLALSVACHTP